MEKRKGPTELRVGERRKRKIINNKGDLLNLFKYKSLMDGC